MGCVELKELEYFTRYYKEVATRGNQIKDFYDTNTARIIDAL